MADIEALELEITSDSNSATDALDRLTAALERLDKITGKATGLSKMNTKMVKLNNTLSNITKSVVSVYAIKKVADILGGFTKKSMAYVENMNLFTVSMGRFADEAAEYANVVSDVMGIDPSTWVRNQGVFMTLASGFGVVEERAYTMSKNLTQLGYDLSSFFNIEYTDAMTKLQAGLSGFFQGSPGHVNAFHILIDGHSHNCIFGRHGHRFDQQTVDLFVLDRGEFNTGNIQAIQQLRQLDLFFKAQCQSTGCFQGHVAQSDVAHWISLLF